MIRDWSGQNLYKTLLEEELGGAALEPLKKKKIAVLYGGRSPEKDISKITGKSISEALVRRGYRVLEYDLDDRFYRDAISGRFDVVFIALHGSPGEDGTVQGFLDLLGIPYVGSGVAASSIAMDKLLTKAVLSSNEIPVARYASFCVKDIHFFRGDKSGTVRNLKEFKELAISIFEYPMVVKPARLGSSVGVSIVRNDKDLKEGIKTAIDHDCCVIVEEYIKGREIQCGIIGRKNPTPLPLIEIVSKREFFDYLAKYTPGEADEITPAPIDDELSRKGAEIAVNAFKVIGCRDFARVDMFLKEDGEYIVSEINTIPGMTPNSLLPKEGLAAGLTYDELVELIAVPALVESLLNQK
jgi:D-alanine-D-alanine ligase